MLITLRALQQDPHPAVRRDVDIALRSLRQVGIDDNLLLNQNLQTAIAMLHSMQNSIPDKDEDHYVAWQNDITCSCNLHKSIAR